MEHTQTTGHLAALMTTIVWGVTFISTKVLLRSFTPVEILFFRFVLGFVALSLASRAWLKLGSWREELMLAGAGLSGICLYYLLENIALTYTMASNVGVIVSAAPFFTALLGRAFLKEERLGVSFFVGFVVAMAGIFCISFNGAQLQLNPIGDLMALAAALLWAVYSILIRKLGQKGYPTIQVTQRAFFYGLVFMLPALFLMDFHLGLERFADPVNLGNILFLGLVACALCFAVWNFAVTVLGAVKTSVYIYLVPVVTVIASALVLHEPVTWLSGLGTVLTLAGLVLSQWKPVAKTPAEV